MPEYVITLEDGTKWRVEGSSPEDANNALNEKRQQERNVKEQGEFRDLPTWQKPFKAADDLARTTADFLTAGQLDKMLGGENAARTEAARSRAGGADVAASAVSALGLPTAVPRIAAAVGGGPIARGLVGTGVAGVEGGAQGAIQAAGHDRPIGPEAAGGAVLGGLAQGAAGAMSAPVNWLAKQFGINALPQAVQIPKHPKAAKGQWESVPTPFQRVEHAAAKAGDDPAKIVREAKKISPTGMAEEEASLLRQVQQGDPGTKAARAIRDAMHGRFGQAMTGGGLIGAITTGNIPLMAASVAPLVAGPLASQSAKMGTRESMEALRRAMRGQSKYEGMLSPKAQAKMGQGLRTQWMEEEEYDY